MFTHRSCWASPSFCQHRCLSASQWNSSQRSCRGNSDRRGRGSGGDDVQHQDSDAGTRRGPLQSLSLGFQATASWLHKSDIQETVVGVSAYLQHWQSLAQHFSRLQEVIGGVNPVFWVLPQICKLLQGGVGLGKVRTRARCEMSGYQQDFIIGCVSVYVCVAVEICEGSSMLKKKSQASKNRAKVQHGGAYKYAYAPWYLAFLTYSTQGLKRKL